MQRFFNNPDFVVENMLKGFVLANPEIKTLKNNERVVVKKDKGSKKVGVITGGGSGHEPAFLGYIGKGMLDAVAVGEVFASPPAKAFYDAMLAADEGFGVACLFGNYAGDNMNVKMAVQMAADEDIDVKYVVANDDIASSPKETKEKRHGIAGGYFMWKVGGARAELGGTLDEVIASAQNIINRTRSICVGLESCIIPAVGKPNFKIANGKMEFGIGHHGEKGNREEDLKNADDIAEEMVNSILDDFEFESSKELDIMLSGLGSTMLMEEYILIGRIIELLKDEGHAIHKVYVGNFVTSLDMRGVSLTVIDLDEEIKELMAYSAEPVGMKNY
ncbi:dihydroxyacetone kinase subunit DhaK [Tetragenococcus halophilus subsp. flandriensis]|uniref:dihydroxyacetone kinase subunit DhaK n=1 Tax=Tetragenococcus halophilus TaxID=51669 RepID=UPI0023E9AB46|nr:dihydroxyacetone kinase subunit DhaK [Tetragenococcus halophilus]GMA08818.1 dihydroxyacetone kinase subunit DhaK [Tetragenococcus halophilus subsp. flandriensis]